MANPPGGPMSGGREAVENYAFETMREQRQQQPTTAERPPQESKVVLSPAELEAAAKEKALLQNEQNAQKRIADFAERFGSTPNTPSKEQQKEQER